MCLSSPPLHGEMDGGGEERNRLAFPLHPEDVCVQAGGGVWGRGTHLVRVQVDHLSG